MINVTLRKKKLKNGRTSLYLDFYPGVVLADGKTTRREFLKLYTFTKPKTEPEKRHNRKIEDVAQLICTKRIVEIAEGVYKTLRFRKDQDFLEFFVEVVDLKKEHSSEANYQTWGATLNHLKKCSPNGKILFWDIEHFAERFRKHLRAAGLAHNTRSLYIAKFRAALSLAVKKRLIDRNTLDVIEPLGLIETKKTFLTFKEIRQLAKTDLNKCPEIKQAALLSSLCGLRFSDIYRLRWQDIAQLSDGYAIYITNKKTKKVQLIPITDEAFGLLGERREDSAKVFPDLKSWDRERIPKWAESAGIKRRVTFHVFRTSNATELLNSGESLSTIQNLLGHKNRRTTEGYTTLLTSTARRAANKLTLEDSDG